MQRTAWILMSLFLWSCAGTKPNKIIRDHGECNVAYLSMDNKNNDTSRIKLIRTAVFDTMATLIHGYLIDSAYKPIQNADVKLFHRDQQITLLTNSKGEFEIFKYLNGDPWNLIIRHKDYICLYVVDVAQTGGQWVYIKLQHM